jgi:hypothetical protein
VTALEGLSAKTFAETAAAVPIAPALLDGEVEDCSEVLRDAQLYRFKCCLRRGRGVLQVLRLERGMEPIQDYLRRGSMWETDIDRRRYLLGGFGSDSKS